MTDALRIVLTTCRAWPRLSTSDATLAEELERRGHIVSALPWNGARLSDFATADMVLLRSNWDFHHELGAFDDWLSVVDDSGADLHNPADLVRLHNHKSYLTRLGKLGIPTADTLTLDRFDVEAMRIWMQERDLETAVIKPAWGASGHAVDCVTPDGLVDAQARWESGVEQRGVLLQEFVPEIRAGEYGLVFFANRFSHALHRQPTAGDFRGNSQYGGITTLAGNVDPFAIALGERVLATLTGTLTYARVDVVGSGENVRLMELEVNEPGLGLDLARGSAARFADALLA